MRSNLTEELWEMEVGTAVVQREVAVAWSGQCYWRGATVDGVWLWHSTSL